MRKYNLEVNWFGAFNSTGWQRINDEPIYADSAEDAEAQFDSEFLVSLLCADDGHGGVIPVEGAEYRFVEED